MMMVVKSQEKQLAHALSEHETLVLKGYTFEVAENIGVVVARGDHVRGFWRCHTHKISWTPAGTFEPSAYVTTIDEAVAFTLTLAQSASGK